MNGRSPEYYLPETTGAATLPLVSIFVLMAEGLFALMFRDCQAEIFLIRP